MKRCTKCSMEKPLTEFYAHYKSADGHQGSCKECTKATVRENYAKKRAQYAAYERERFRSPERKAYALAAQSRHRARHPDRYHARSAVGNAVRDGRLVRQPCKVCGAQRVQAHHHDYSKPLDVEWLCFRCHREHEHGQVTQQR